ncbi:MAG: hypothetical protein A2Y17_02300 [Clostridiales bacterium GWF2_38_85]|nr:MAG: hypothetical protein A2Y17_02300 [Clostridiales bacterium GWF2_38_85]
MNLKPVIISELNIPPAINAFIGNAPLYDSSCSKQAKTVFIDMGNGYFLKIAPKGCLNDEALMTEYLYTKGLSARVCDYQSDDMDYLITEKIYGEDGITQKYLDNPKRLTEVFAECLYRLHSVGFDDCPKQNRIVEMWALMEKLKSSNTADPWLLEYVEMSDPALTYRYLTERRELLKNDALIHGDYCLPNILLKDFSFSGYIDVGYGGVGDRHYDLFWGVWTLQYNFHTNDFKDRFLDCYGRGNVDMERFKLCGILSALTWDGTE